MTRKQARRLIGGYATGSLNEVERKLLFEAALEDQELFDELAREQELKELIESPGVRERLLAAVQPRRKTPVALWAKPWPWIGVAAAVGAAMVVWIVLLDRTSRPVQVAVLEAPTGRAAQAEEAPAAPPPAVTPPGAPQADQEPAAAAAAPAAPVPVVEDLAKTAAAEPVAPPETLAAAAPAGARAEFSPEAAKQTVVLARAAPLAAFDYTLSNRVLAITPATAGFLTVASADAVIFPRSPVAANARIELTVPADAAEILVTFSLEETPPPGPTESRTELTGRLASATERVLRLALPVPR